MSKPIFPHKRRAGIFNKKARFWRGERAEDIVKARVEVYKRKKKRKRKKSP